MSRFVVYGDFNCPFSALASARVGELEQRGAASFEWRAVEHDTSIPPEGAAMEGELAGGLLAELTQIRGLLRSDESDRLRLPRRQVNTAQATRRYAGTDPDSRATLRQALFAAHWQHGEPIDDDAVLDRLGAGPGDRAAADAWREAWQRATTPIVPVLVLPDGYVSRGLGALARLSALLDG